METAEPMASRWDAEAHRYDDEPDHGLRDPFVRQAWRSVLTAFLPPPPADVLDVACGTGSLAVLLAESGYRVTGIDASRAMLAIARRKADHAGVAVNLDHRDATTSLGDLGRFDAVLARYVVWLLPDPAAAVRRWLNTARSDGALVLIEDRFWPGPSGSSRDLLDVVQPVARLMAATVLDDPALWGGTAADDERVLLVCGERDRPIHPDDRLTTGSACGTSVRHVNGERGGRPLAVVRTNTEVLGTSDVR